MKSIMIDLDAEFVRETEKARLFRFELPDGPVWLPKAQHEWDEESGEVTLREPLAIDKGLV